MGLPYRYSVKGWFWISGYPFWIWMPIWITWWRQCNATSIQTLFTTIFFFISAYMFFLAPSFFIDNTGLGTSHGNDDGFPSCNEDGGRLVPEPDSDCHGYWASSPPPLPCSDRQVQMTSPYMQPMVLGLVTTFWWLYTPVVQYQYHAMNLTTSLLQIL